MTISNDTRGRVKKIGEPIALFFGRLGLTPDGLTLIGFGITTVGAILLGLQLWVVGGLVVFVGGVFDMFDGTLARATGTGQQARRLHGLRLRPLGRGARLRRARRRPGRRRAGPSDRSWRPPRWPRAFLVSYARAKSEGLGFSAGTGMAAVGVMPREIRLVILCGGLVIGGLLGTEPVRAASRRQTATPPGILVIDAALAIIAIGATITVIQRVLHTRAQARSAAAAAATTTEGADPAS